MLIKLFLHKLNNYIECTRLNFCYSNNDSSTSIRSNSDIWTQIILVKLKSTTKQQHNLDDTHEFQSMNHHRK